MSCHIPAKMVINGIGFTAVSRSVFCAQICKQTVRSWRFFSNVTYLDSENSDLQSSNDEVLKTICNTRTCSYEIHPTGEVPAAFASIPQKINSIRILDENTANEIAKAVHDVFDRNNLILDIDAGAGLLSKALLTLGMKNVVALEPHHSMYAIFEEIKQSHEKSFSYFFKTIDDVLAYSDEEFSTNLPGIRKTKEGCDVQIIGQVASWHLLVDISRRMRGNWSFLSGKSLRLCLCLPQDTWDQFLDSKVQKMCVVERILFQIAYEYEILTTIQKKHFYFKLYKRDQMKLNPNSNMVLVHIKSKPIHDFDLSELQVFLSQFHNCVSRNRLVIPSLELWAPSSGEELIRRGMLVFTKFSDLQPEELLDVFRYFKTLPNIETLNFMSMMK